MKVISLVVGLMLAAAVAAGILLDGVWSVRLTDGTQAEVSLPGTLGLAGIGPSADKAVYGALTPRYQYVGKAVYFRTFEVPEGVSGDYELVLERVMWKSEARLDGVSLGTCDSLVVPHIYTMPKGKLTPGRHTLALTVDNTQILPIGEAGHCYGDSMQTRWHGVVGELLLRPVNPLRGSRVFAPFGDTVTVELPAGLSADGYVEGVKTETVSSVPGKLVLRVPGAKAWSDCEPNLYTLLLRSGTWEHRIRFGFRTVARKGNRLLLNGRPLFLRGNLECACFPLTAHPPMDRTAWLRIFRALRAEGVNQARFHSWCPPQAAFDAADELGMIVSPEILWIDGWMRRDFSDILGLGHGPKAVDMWTRTEISRVLEAYGNAPSFLTLTIGNELGSSDFGLMGCWLAECKANDSRRLYSASSSFVQRLTPSDDFLVGSAYPGIGPIRGRYPEGTDWDYEDVYSRTAVPTIAHEIGQWPVFPEFDAEIPKYAGALRAWNLEELRAKSVAAGVLRFNRAYARASLMTCLLMYKDEIESFLRTPSCSGVQLLGVQDYAGQGEALIGWLDAFYVPKPGAARAVPVADFFADVTCLARFSKHLWTTGETFTARLVVRNNGGELLDRTIPWSFAGRSDNVRVSVPAGAVVQVAEVSVPLADVKNPVRQELRFGKNRWPIWVYPATVSADVPTGVIYTTDVTVARKALAAGKFVVFNACGQANPKRELFSAFRPVYWSTTWFPSQRNSSLGLCVRADSSAFASFPTEDWQDWQWRHLVDGATAFRLEGRSEAFVPLIMPIVDFHKPALAALLFEAKIGNGSVLVSGINLDADLPEARWLKRSLLDYVASEDFAPCEPMTLSELMGLFNAPPAKLSPRPEALAEAIVYIECSAFLSEREKTVPHRSHRDRAEMPNGGAYALSGDGLVAWADATGGYWAGDRLALVLSGMPNESSSLRLRFRDPNATGRTAEGMFEGRPFTIPPHVQAKEATHWISLPVSREDTLDGKLELEVFKTGGHNVMIDRVVLMPGT